ncbi:CidA/LrgA family protein [Desertibacillus haloalkaliphilus]|uniref:CidA/LrgA family protein n=1 Tax=Desertibacillus haloalkaliphilus TaxID=1328930 RepID=UPI001C261523|nr:CidA/LrgA family protein [Desertibacillus haloalkaliphilus]MBU8905259.1 CidA/LrgA family protein [Desertibacillus haloalkaliphilus]
MTLIRICIHISVLYGFYFIGSWIQQRFDLFIPGSIIGMLLLLVLFATRLLPTRWIEEGTTLLLRHMPLLFLPVTVGVLNYLDLFAGSGILLVFIALFSTLLVMVASGLTSQWLAVRKERSQTIKKEHREQKITTGM